MKIAIVGLGDVGLPLSLQFARSGVDVLGLDIDPPKIEAINKGQSYIKHIEPAMAQERVKAGRLSASTDFSRVKEVEAVIICVPTRRSTKTASRTSPMFLIGQLIMPSTFLVGLNQPHRDFSQEPAFRGQSFQNLIRMCVRHAPRQSEHGAVRQQIHSIPFSSNSFPYSLSTAMATYRRRCTDQRAKQRLYQRAAGC
jgi:hypothetical protein